jgi:hypothetical protein
VEPVSSCEIVCHLGFHLTADFLPFGRHSVWPEAATPLPQPLAGGPACRLGPGG